MVAGVVRDLRGRAERTPAGRDREVDFLRALAILAVVAGHWLAVAVTFDADGFGGTNALGVLSWSHPLTWLFQVMPVFFVVGGYANAASLASHRARGGDLVGWLLARTARILAPTTLLLVVLAAAVISARAMGADPGELGTMAWLVSVPLWFLTVYVAVVVLTPWTHALHRRAGLIVPAALVVGVAAGDLARLGLDMPYLGEANYLFAWLAVHQAGFAWQDGTLPARGRVALPLAIGGLVALLLLTTAGPYPVSMVAVPGADVDNTAPPTLALLALATTQIGLALLVRDPLSRWLGHRRPWLAVVVVNAVVLTLFLWHMVAVVLGALLLYPTGIAPQPPVDSATWLAWRVPWLACLAAVLVVLVAAAGRVELRGAARSPTGTGGRTGGPGRERARVVLVAVGLGAAFAGLLGITVADSGDHGPAGLPSAALLAYLAGAAALRGARRLSLTG